MRQPSSSWQRWRSLLLALAVSGLCSAAKRKFRTPVAKTATAETQTYTILTIVVMIVIGVCLLTCRWACPNGLEFTALELDEIRLERLTSIERGIRQNIRDLKAKLNFHKDKRKKVQRELDIKNRLQNFAQGHGDSADGENEFIYDQRNYSPIRNFPSPSPVKRNEERVPLILDRDDDDGEEVRGAVEEKADAGEAEEKEDLWRLWNSMASHKIAAKKPAAPVEERKAEEPRRQYQTIRFGAQAPPASAPAPAQQRTDSQWLSGRPTAAAAPSAYAIDPQLAPSLSSAPPASTAAENYSISVPVKDYKAAEKYSLEVTNPLLARPSSNQSHGREARQTESAAPSRPAPPKKPPPPHVLLKRRLEKMTSEPAATPAGGQGELVPQTSQRPQPPRGPPPAHVVAQRRPEGEPKIE